MQWVPDSLSSLCYSCGKAFSLTLRKHHCRECGNIFCDNCTTHKLPLPHRGEVLPVRVCAACYYHLTRSHIEDAAVVDGEDEVWQSVGGGGGGRASEPTGASGAAAGRGDAPVGRARSKSTAPLPREAMAEILAAEREVHNIEAVPGEEMKSHLPGVLFSVSDSKTILEMLDGGGSGSGAGAASSASASGAGGGGGSAGSAGAAGAEDDESASGPPPLWRGTLIVTNYRVIFCPQKFQIDVADPLCRLETVAVPHLTIARLSATELEPRDMAILELVCKDFRVLRFCFEGLVRNQFYSNYRHVQSHIEKHMQLKKISECFAFRSREFGSAEGALSDSEMPRPPNQRWADNACLIRELERAAEPASTNRYQRRGTPGANADAAAVAAAAATAVALPSASADAMTASPVAAAAATAEQLVPSLPAVAEVSAPWDWSPYLPVGEWRRIGVPNDAWRFTQLNSSFNFCASYASTLVVPRSVSDEELIAVGKYRSRQRVPVLCWMRTGTLGPVLMRSSQPLAGVMNMRCKEDEKLLAEAVRNAPRRELVIVDARPTMNAVAQTAFGAGYENVAFYEESGAIAKCHLTFVGVENIHVMRKSYSKLFELCVREIEKPDALRWWPDLSDTGWLYHIASILHGSLTVVSALQRDVSVLVHCSDGWDRTSQLCATAQLILDPYYRTMDGFVVLIEKEWAMAGHKFFERVGHGVAGTENENSPVFAQWLDCVWQLLDQFPEAFEFNQQMLICILDHLYSCRFGNFLFNNELEIRRENLEHSTHSLWAYLQDHSAEFRNPHFAPDESLVLVPDVRRLRFWADYYLRWTSLAVRRGGGVLNERVVTFPQGLGRVIDSLSSARNADMCESIVREIIADAVIESQARELDRLGAGAQHGRAWATPDHRKIMSMLSLDTEDDPLWASFLNLDHTEDDIVPPPPDEHKTPAPSAAPPQPLASPSRATQPRLPVAQDNHPLNAAAAAAAAAPQAPAAPASRTSASRGSTGDARARAPTPVEGAPASAARHKAGGGSASTSTSTSSSSNAAQWPGLPLLPATPVIWTPDEAAPRCKICGDEFTFFRRRHHCRICGGVVCSSCAGKSQVANSMDKVWVCFPCYRGLQTQPY